MYPCYFKLIFADLCIFSAYYLVQVPALFLLYFFHLVISYIAFFLFLPFVFKVKYEMINILHPTFYVSLKTDCKSSSYLTRSLN